MHKEDLDHLNLLAIFHYILGALSGLASCIPIIHLAVGIFMLVSPETIEPSDTQEQQTFQLIGGLVIGLAIIVILVGLTAAVCMILTGRFLQRKTGYLFCMVVAALECLSFPFGTILGVFTIIVLSRDSVKALFGRG